MKYNKNKCAIFTKEEKMLNHLILHANDVPNAIGLLDGKMGIALVLAHYARCSRKKKIEHAADFLVENVMNQLTTTVSIDFANGLSGIGWGIEYLIQNNYMKGCGADILQDLDERIMQVDVTRIKDWSLEKGLLGILHYVLYHLQGANKSELRVFDKPYLASWLSILKDNEDLHKLLQKGLDKEKDFYKSDLHIFIKQQSRVDTKKLSLGNGLAGKIELLMLNNQ
ncbi:lanthionine synthetase LanC family protein [Prevotellamassilia timonensis]|uniref:lanthionine synthetase LanC family protein n=1 Tax=Prevotellamassilia timonensis TaxID=1852370 RepID=UPI003A8D9EA9